RDWSSDVCSSDLHRTLPMVTAVRGPAGWCGTTRPAPATLGSPVGGGLERIEQGRGQELLPRPRASPGVGPGGVGDAARRLPGRGPPAAARPRVSLMAFDIDDGRIVGLDVLADPDRLREVDVDRLLVD